MIQVRRKDGIEVDIETFNDPALVERLLSRVLQPEAYAALKARVAEAEEIFFEFTGENKEELPRVRHYLIHLDSRPGGKVNLSRGDFVIVFYVRRDSLSVAKEMATALKGGFKRVNDWQHTTEYALEADKFFVDLPREE